MGGTYGRLCVFRRISSAHWTVNYLRDAEEASTAPRTIMSQKTCKIEQPEYVRPYEDVDFVSMSI